MNILSIDWDYFFPDSYPYDWGHRESLFFLETIWPVRLTSHNIITSKSAFEEYKPTVPTDFWKRVVKNKNPLIYVAESHASIMALPFKGATVTNLDAHHDCGYGNKTSLECGNWALMAKRRISKYHLCYPKWRESGGEGTPERKPASIIYGLPEATEYDLVFICRSGCWTPPWYDTEFRDFLKQSGGDVNYMDQYIDRDRNPNMKEAKILKVQMDEQFKSLQEKVA